MKNLKNYLKRYYECIFNFKLYNTYLDEPVYKALLFLLPIFVFLAAQSYTTMTSDLNYVKKNLDYYYDQISTITYNDITSQAGDYQMSDIVNFSFYDGAVQIPQTKVYDVNFGSDNQSFRLILDTQNQMGLSFNSDGQYSAKDQKAIGHNQYDIVIYVGDEFSLISTRDRIIPFNTSGFEGSEYSTVELYTVIKQNIAPFLPYFTISCAFLLFIYGFFFFGTYLLSRTTLKRLGYGLSKRRTIKIALYCIQPGVYVYLILSNIAYFTGISLSLVIPVLSMIAMAYVATKTLENVKDLVKREDRKIRKQSKRQKLQAES